MKHSLFILLVICSSFFMTGCNKFDRKTESELNDVIQRNLKASQDENIEMALMDIDDPMKEQTKALLETLFEQYDLSYKIIKIKILSCDEETAEVEVVQETRKIKGPDFNDNVCTTIHTLKKRPTGWKFVASKIKSFEALETK